MARTAPRQRPLAVSPVCKRYSNIENVMNNSDVAIAFICWFYSFINLFLIDRGLEIKYQFVFAILAVISLIIYVLSTTKSSWDYVNYGSFTTSIFISFLYHLMNFVSWKINKREFRINMKGFNNENNANTNSLDTIFSFIIIFSILFWPILVDYLFT